MENIGKRKIYLPACLIFVIGILLSYQLLFVPTAFAQSSSSRDKDYLDQIALQGEKECVQPPQNVDLMTLSDAELQLYGLPTHQTLDRNPQHWSQILSYAKHRTCGTHPGKIHHKHLAENSEVDSDNWAGNEATGDRGTYREAEVTFTVPNEAPGESQDGASASDDASFWAGVGGDPGVSSPAVVVQAGVDTQWTGLFQYNESWWEVAPNIATEQNLPLCNLDTGSQVYIYVASNDNSDGYNYFYIENESHSCYNSHTDRTAFSDSATGECIAERPLQGGDYYYGLVDFDTIRFTGCYINTAAINLLPHFYHNMVSLQTGDTLATVGAIANNTDYTVYWHNWT